MKMIEIPEQEYEALKGLVASLTTKVADLEARLNKTSKNSNKPPSTDGPRKNTVKNSRTPSGGQQGREGKTLELTPTPDTTVELIPRGTCECGGSIIVRCEDNYTVRQVTDITHHTPNYLSFEALSYRIELCKFSVISYMSLISTQSHVNTTTYINTITYIDTVTYVNTVTYIIKKASPIQVSSTSNSKESCYAF